MHKRKETMSENTDQSPIHLIPYNTGMEPLLLSEYGRVVQDMVSHCVMIEDRAERTACAQGIVDTMRKIYARIHNNKKVDEAKFWDQLNIMARFELDIDFPCEVTSADDAHPVPDKIPYTPGVLRERHYGRHIEKMVAHVSEMEAGEEKDELIFMIAGQMKKLLMVANPSGANDQRVFQDLYAMSRGRISLDTELHCLKTFNPNQLPDNGPKKKLPNRKNTRNNTRNKKRQ